MKIQVGSIIDMFSDQKNIALNIPGIGIVKSIIDKDDEPFHCIILNKEQLISLKNEITKEIGE